jgi:hypothetical protein
MARRAKSAKGKKDVEALVHDEASRKNIPTAELPPSPSAWSGPRHPRQRRVSGRNADSVYDRSRGRGRTRSGRHEARRQAGIAAAPLGQP